LPEEPESFDIQGFYCFEDGQKINVIPYQGPEKELEYPIFPKGKRVEYLAEGCLMVPKHGGT